MASNVKITKNGDAGKGADRGTRQSIEATCKEVVKEAKRLAPIDEGDLQDSYDYRILNDANAIVGTDEDYVIYPEFGTRYQAAQPSLRPAAKAAKGFQSVAAVKKAMFEEMRKELK